MEQGIKVLEIRSLEHLPAEKRWIDGYKSNIMWYEILENDTVIAQFSEQSAIRVPGFRILMSKKKFKKRVKIKL